MENVILLSELARAKPSRLREPLPEGGATISLFLGVRYERWDTKHETLEHAASKRGSSKHEAFEHATLQHGALEREVVTAADASFVA
jgi:hypothetical protein